MKFDIQLKGELFISFRCEELITEHAIAWNQRKINGMAQSLSRYTRVSIYEVLLNSYKTDKIVSPFTLTSTHERKIFVASFIAYYMVNDLNFMLQREREDSVP